MTMDHLLSSDGPIIRSRSSPSQAEFVLALPQFLGAGGKSGACNV
jgi:hypothetical protein